MNLSQDEINALLSGDQTEEAEAVEIMSPEAIAAMLDTAAAAQPPAGDGDAVDIMSPEAIEAMLDTSAGGIEGGEPAGDDAADDLDALFSRYEEETPPAAAPAASAEAAAQPAAAQTTANFDSQYAKEGLLTAQEIDILGEVGNISMGAVATTMYSLLDRRVSITTPRVTVFDVKDVLSIYQIPFVVATIEYVEGITGSNLLVLKVEDAALISDILMGGEGVVEQPIVLNDMHLSVMSEIMNQMMGASSTSLSKLLHTTVNISAPKSSQVDVGFDVTELLGDIDMVTKISFDMDIEGLLNSELIQLMPYDVSREFAKRFMDVGVETPSTKSAAAASPAAPAPAAAAQAAPPPQAAAP
ncbi:MAG: flagellar motor switch phosphatase FliY, partial [Oscillospiraceae bacterium]|nr:flagellar motor switch phosphatase FliY [Oscillospiraceae bacterium]